MTPEERVRRGGAVLAFDTNAIVRPGKEGRVSFERFMRCCDAANRLRKANKKLDVWVVVPALVHFEVLHDLRVSRGAGFDPKQVNDALESKGVEIGAFDAAAAEGAAGVLHGWFPGNEQWRAEKKQNCLGALGIGAAPGHGLATIDWPISAHGEASKWILVTGDKGAEFRRSTLKVTATEASELLDKLVVERVGA